MILFLKRFSYLNYLWFYIVMCFGFARCTTTLSIIILGGGGGGGDGGRGLFLNTSGCAYFRFFSNMDLPQ